MNIIEAIKSGKKFRRACWTHRVIDPAVENVLETTTFDAIIADDWEVEEPEKSVVWATFIDFAESLYMDMGGKFDLEILVPEPIYRRLICESMHRFDLKVVSGSELVVHSSGVILKIKPNYSKK